MTTAPQDLAPTAAPVDGDAVSLDSSPGLAAPFDHATAVLSVDPHCVEYGDIILGLRTPVTSILTDGTSWFYGDDRGTFIAKRHSWGKVQVIRGADQEAIAESLADPDDCPPHGITRGRGGLYVVLP